MTDTAFPIGQRVTLPGHFPEPVVLEAVRPIGAGYECRVRLLDGTPDEAILSREEAAAAFGQTVAATTQVRPADADDERAHRLTPRPLARTPEPTSHGEAFFR